LLCSGAACLTASAIPLIHEWGLYFVPFLYLRLLGLALLAAGAAALAAALTLEGPFDFVRRGIPIAARVRDISFTAPKFNVPLWLIPGLGELRRFLPRSMKSGFEVELEYRDPDRGELATASTWSRALPTLSIATHTTSFRRGDYVTAVYLPEDPAKSLRLYTFLDLHPGLGVVVRHSGRPSKPWSAAFAVSIVGLILFVVAWTYSVFDRYYPVDVTGSQMLILLSGGLVPLVLTAAFRHFAPSRKEEEKKRRAEAIADGRPNEIQFGKKGEKPEEVPGCVLVAAGAFMGFVTLGPMFLTWTLSINALLDRSGPLYYRVSIVSSRPATTGLVFRNYTIHYRFVDAPDRTRKYPSSPGEIAMFQNGRGYAEVHQGYFGWRWVKRLWPDRAKQVPVQRPR
jgi:hypothetical protein